MNYLRNIRFHVHFMVKIMLILFAFLGLLLIVAYQTYYTSQIKNIEMYLEEIITQIAMNINSKLEQTYILANNTYLNTDIQHDLENDNAMQSTVYDRYITSQNISTLSQGNSYINSIVLYPFNGLAYETGNSNIRFKAFNDLENQAWFQELSDSESGFSLLDPENNFLSVENEQNIVLARPIFSDNSKQTIGYQFVVLNKSLFGNKIVNDSKNQMVQFYLSNSKGRLLFTKPETSRMLTKEFNSSRYIVKQIQITNDIYLLGVCDKDLISREALQPMWFMLAFAIAAMIIGLLSFSVMSQAISKPIRQLIFLTKKVGEGNFNLKIPRYPVIELDDLGENFGRMVHRIEELIQNLTNEQICNKNLELKLLMSQLNPHFLYNTLHSIYWMIMLDNDHEETASMVESLSNMMRYGLYNLDTRVTISQEIQHCKDYLFLQSKRFEDRFDWLIDIPDELQGCLIPKLIFQPLVENAVIHGVEPSSDTVHIYILAYNEENDIVFEFRNTGVELSERKLEEIESYLGKAPASGSTKSEKGGIGLYNIHRRIQLTYGPNYGLEILRMGKGFCIKVKISGDLTGSPNL